MVHRWAGGTVSHAFTATNQVASMGFSIPFQIDSVSLRVEVIGQ